MNPSNKLEFSIDMAGPVGGTVVFIQLDIAIDKIAEHDPDGTMPMPSKSDLKQEILRMIKDHFDE